MDIKTLEYMEERTKKARELVNKIDYLKKTIDLCEEVAQVHFRSQYGDRLFDTSIVSSLTNEMKEAYIKAATNEIGALEQQLSEL